MNTDRTMNMEHTDNRTLNIPYWLAVVITVTFITITGFYLKISDGFSEVKSDIRLIQQDVQSIGNIQTQVHINRREIDRLKYVIENQNLDTHYLDSLRYTQINKRNR